MYSTGSWIIRSNQLILLTTIALTVDSLLFIVITPTLVANIFPIPTVLLELLVLPLDARITLPDEMFEDPLHYVFPQPLLLALLDDLYEGREDNLEQFSLQVLPGNFRQLLEEDVSEVKLEVHAGPRRKTEHDILPEDIRGLLH